MTAERPGSIPMTGKEIAALAVAADTIPRVVRDVLAGKPMKSRSQARTRVECVLREQGKPYPVPRRVRGKARGRTAPKL